MTGADLRQLGKFLADDVINGIPVAPDDSLLTDENREATVEVLANDTNPDGGVLAVSTVGQAATGAAVLIASGTMISVSDADHHEIATFPYQVAARQFLSLRFTTLHWLRMTLYQRLRV